MSLKLSGRVSACNRGVKNANIAIVKIVAILAVVTRDREKIVMAYNLQLIDMVRRL
jgi:hypothetical protein